MKENQFAGVSGVQFNNDFEKFLNLDDNLKLTRQYIKEENEWKKTKAILEQKIDLLKLEIEDSKKREENLHKMNETILASLNDLANDSNKASTSKILFKDLLDRIDEYNKDFLEKKEKNWEVVSKYDKENKLLRDNINEMQMKFKDNEFNFEKTRLALEHKVQELELIIKQLKGSQKTSEDDKKRIKDIHEREIHSKKEEFSREIEILKQNHQYEIERMRQISNVEVNDLKELYEKEKAALDSKLDRLEKDLKEYRRIIEENPPSKQHDASNLYTEENLNIIIHEITEKKDLKIKELETINYELTKKVQNLEKDSRNLPLDNNQEMLNLRKENSQQNRTIVDLKKKGDNLEDSVETLKRILSEKESQLDDYKSQLDSISQKKSQIDMFSQKKPQNMENERNDIDDEDQINMNYKDYRRYFKYSSINTYPKEKEHSAAAIYKTPIKNNEPSYKPEEFQNDASIYSRSYKSQNNQEDYNKRSPINRFHNDQRKSPYIENRITASNNQNVMDLMKSTTSIQYKAQENIENYSEQEDTDKIIEKMKDHNISRKYYKNIEDKASNNTIPVPYDDFLNNRQKKILKESNQEKINEDILTILMQLNREKSTIEEKLAELEKRLSESENANENLLYEKEKLKNELNKIYQEVKIAKSGLGHFEEMTYASNQKSNNKNQNINNNSNNNNISNNINDKDATLKTEIKFLINKLLKAKGKLVKEKTDVSFKDNNSAYKSINYYSNTSTYEINRKSSEKKKNLSNTSFDPKDQKNRSRTPILYKDTRNKDLYYVKENVS